MTNKKQVPSTSAPEFDFRSITSFELACSKTGATTDLPTLTAGQQELLNPIVAAYKLMVIFKAINDGWIPDWSNTNQRKWFPWFGVLPSGSGFSGSGTVYRYGDARVGSRLCTDTEDKSDYIRTHFVGLYEELFLYK